MNEINDNKQPATNEAPMDNPFAEKVPAKPVDVKESDDKGIAKSANLVFILVGVTFLAGMIYWAIGGMGQDKGHIVPKGTGQHVKVNAHPPQQGNVLVNAHPPQQGNVLVNGHAPGQFQNQPLPNQPLLAAGQQPDPNAPKKFISGGQYICTKCGNTSLPHFDNQGGILCPVCGGAMHVNKGK